MSDQSLGQGHRLFLNGERLRVRVDSPPSGGGPKFEPRTPEEARDLLLPMVRSTVASAMELPSRLRGDRIYVEARLVPNYLAPSYFPDALLAQVGAEPVGSRADTAPYVTKSRVQEATTRKLVLAIDDDGLSMLQSLVESGGRSRSERQAFAEIRKIDEIELAPLDEVILAQPSLDAELLTWEAVLHPASVAGGEALSLDTTTMAKWFHLVRLLGGESYQDYSRSVGGLTFAPVRLPAGTIDEVARFNPLRSIRPMPPLRPRPRMATRVASRPSTPPSLDPLHSSPRIAVFDGGIRSSPGGVLPDPHVDLTPEPVDDVDVAHGSGVASAVKYGLVRPGEQMHQPPCPVDSFRVLPAPLIPGDLDGYWVLDEIIKVVSSNEYSIVNLSLGPELATEDTSEPNRWTSELDQLAWEQDVLFVVAAGNDGAEDEATGLNRVQVPGDMVNGLTVGACDADPPTHPWARAPYSSVGPGRHGNRVQPAGVQFGGIENDPFPVLQSDRSFWETWGTSFSAPLLTHALGDLATRLPQVTPSVLRAFAVHYAERHRSFRRLVNEVGHGRLPLSFETLLTSSADEAHVLFVDRIERGELLGYRIPAPAKPTGDIELSLTLAYLSPVEPSEPTEYTRASLETVLRPHQRMHSFRPPDGTNARSSTLDFTSADALRLMSEGWTMSQEPISKSLGAAPGSSEQRLRDAGKWETVRHHRVKLKKEDIDQPRLELSYVARRTGSLDRSPTEVPFALLVSLRDLSAAGTLHGHVAAQFPVLAQLPAAAAQVRV